MSPETSQLRNEFKNAYGLYKKEKYSDALRAYQKLYKTNSEEFGSSDKLFYAKSIHEAKIKNNKKALEIEEAGNLILDLIEQEDCSDKDSIRCPYTNAILDVANFFYRKKSYTKTLFWCNQLNPDYLSRESYMGLDCKVHPSKKEKWAVIKSKTLLENKQYPETIEFINGALDELDEFHENNDMWLRYRRGQANNILGNFQEAIDDLEFALAKKKVWNFQEELAYAYYNIGDHDNAFRYAVDCALNSDEVWKKVKVYKIISDILYERNLEEEARKHVYLLYTIGLAKGNSTDEYMDRLENHGLDLTSKDYEKVENDLEDLWMGYKFENVEPYTGRIATLPTKNDLGFIVTDDYDYYHFDKKDFKDKKRLIELNLPVRFHVNKDVEQTKKLKFDMAYNIRINK